MSSWTPKLTNVKAQGVINWRQRPISKPNIPMKLSLLTTRYNSGLGFCRVFPRGTLGKEKWHWKIETLKQSLAFLEKCCCCLRKFSQEHSCLPIWYERQFCCTVSYSTHPSPMFSMFMKLFKQDPQLLGPGHVVLHSWPRISKSFISRPRQVPHIGGGASAPEGRVEKPLPPNRRIKPPSEKSKNCEETIVRR